MGEFKKSGGFNKERQGQGFNNGGGSRTQRAGRPSYDSGHSNRPRFGADKGSFSRSDGPRPQMFSAICSECNRKCEVPFRPSGDRPVFCNDCFGNKRGSPQGNFTRRDFTPSAPVSKLPAEDKRIDEIKRQLDAVNKKLDTMIEMMKVSPAIDVVKVSSVKKVKATNKPEEGSGRRMIAKKSVKAKK